MTVAKSIIRFIARNSENSQMHIAQIDVAVRSNQPRRGRVILMAGLTAREIFPPCHYFATTKLWENESCHLGRNEMAGLKGKSGASRQDGLVRLANTTVKFGFLLISPFFAQL